MKYFFAKIGAKLQKGKSISIFLLIINCQASPIASLSPDPMGRK
jgi:hypothetical protein